MNSSFKIIGIIVVFNCLSIFGMNKDFRKIKKMRVPRTEKCSLQDAVEQENFTWVEKILKKEAIDKDSTILFAARTVKMAQLLIKNGANVYVNDDFIICDRGEFFQFSLLENVIMNKDFEPELVSLYSQYENEFDKNKHLLHTYLKFFNGIEDNSFKKIKLLLEARPFLINTLNAKNKTPLDKAERRCESIKEVYLYFNLLGLYKPEYEELCMFLKEKGAKTALALQQEHEKERKKLAENIQTPCIICFELKDKDSMKIVPCAKMHLERLCTDCLASVKNVDNQCPLCREQLG